MTDKITANTYDNICQNIETIQAQAANGDADAQNKIGICYHKGIAGYPQDYSRAAEWFAKSAEQGLAEAQANLADCYFAGAGINQDYKKAVEWNAKAAEQNNTRALCNLGYLYGEGLGVEKNASKAFELYSKAAATGDVYALVNVAICYEKGLGAPKSYVTAASYYQQAAKQGDKYAQDALERIADKVEEEEFFSSINFSTKQKIASHTYARAIPFGKNYIVKKKQQWGIVDKLGRILLPIDYQRVYWIDDEFAYLQHGKQWGLVNNKGEITIQSQYDFIRYIPKLQVCDVVINGECYVVDTNNNIVMKVPGKHVYCSGNKMEDDSKIKVHSEETVQLYNLDGTPFSKPHNSILFDGDYYYGYDYNDEDDCNVVQFYINQDGSEVKMPPYEISVFSNGFAKFRHHDKYGIIDSNANIVLPNKYDFIDLGDGIIAINEGHKSKDFDKYFYVTPRSGEWYFVDFDYKAVTPFRYELIKNQDSDNGKCMFAKRDGRWYQITPQGESLFATTEKEFRVKTDKLKRECEKQRRSKKDLGEFSILEDTRYCGEGRKLFVRSCDGYYIRTFYITPYLAIEAGIAGHYEIGEYFVNKYGQEIPNFNSGDVELPKQKKPRYIFRLDPEIMKLSDDELRSTLIELIKPQEYDPQEVMVLYSVFQTKRRCAILCDWLIRKYLRKKSFKIPFNELAMMGDYIKHWERKHC